jgi:hypothetical protein
VSGAVTLLEAILSAIASVLWVASTKMRSLNDQARWNRYAAMATAATAFVHFLSLIKF